MIAGLGGGALVAAMLSLGGHSASAPPEAKSDKPDTVAAAANSPTEVTHNQDGPWYAFCQEYATDQFDRGNGREDELGVSTHRVPSDAEGGTTELRRPVHVPGKPDETEKFSVKEHVIGNLPTCVPDGAKLRVMIATVPDPNKTQMALDFDRDIIAIQTAAAAQHYLYTGYWFPWRAADWTPEKSGDTEAETRRREEPGILCFRGKNAEAKTGAAERLFVFLVGETPTSGINRLQFSHALYYREKLRAAGDIEDRDKDRLGISGPHFSASFPVLEDVLSKTVIQALPSTMPFIDFVSPDASGRSQIDDFSKFCHGTWVPQCVVNTLALGSEDANLITQKYLIDGLHYKPWRIASLGEDESAFGETSDCSPGPNSPQECGYGLRLKFPRDLSSLRSISDRESEEVARSGSKYISLPNDALPTTLGARQPIERDTPETLAQQQEAAEVQRSLDDSVEEMRAKNIQAVVVSASNPLDRVYLLEFLRNKLPDVRVVTIDADELELGSPHFVDFTGTIAVTSLPVLPAMVPFVRPDDQIAASPHSFRSSRQEGEYLAMVALLDSGDPIQPPADHKPCYAISVVEKDGFRLMPYEVDKAAGYPLFPCSRDSSNLKPLLRARTTVTRHSDAPGSFLAFLLGIVVLNAVYLRCVLNSRRSVEGLLSYPHGLTGQNESRRLYLLFILNNQLLLLNLLGLRVAVTLFCQSGKPDVHDLRLNLLFSLVTLSFLALACRSLFLLWRCPKGAAFPVVYLVSTIWMVCALPALGAHQAVFIERITSLSEGLSPLLPISAILMGYALWGWMQLKRLDWIASRRIDLQLQPAMNRDLHDRIEIILKDSEELSSSQPVIYIVLCPLALFGGYLLHGGLRGFDGEGFYYWFLFWGIVMLLLTVMLTCFQAWSIWDQLRQLLEWLETTPLQRPFQKIGEDGLVHINIWEMASQRRSFAVLSATVDSIGRIFGLNSTEQTSAAFQLDEFIRADAEGRQVASGVIAQIHGSLNVALPAAVASMLEPGRKNVPRESQLYLALRLVAFIRYAMLHCVTLIAFVAYGYVLAVFSVMFYPFAGRKTLGELLTLTFVALLIWIGWMMVQFQKNAMLSKLEGSTPGEVSYAQLAFHLLTVGGVPLLALATAQFPALGQFVFSLLRPVLGALH